ncbi:MAG: flavin reductase family protein, partial [Spirochaetes bacterium]|nr:flavin reductase family protein [Spirochaetota bacterium]
MNKVIWKPGTMVYPLPAVLVSCGTIEEPNILTVAWTGTVCTEPAMTYISIRPERYSYDIIKKTKEFAINITTRRLAFAVDFCGVKSGRDINKFEALKLTPAPAQKIKAPIILESPVNIECRVTEIKPLGSHHMFLAKVLAINADKEYINK